MAQTQVQSHIKRLRAHHKKHKKAYRVKERKFHKRITVLRARAKQAGASGLFSWLGKFKRWVTGHGKRGLKAAAEIVKKEAAAIAAQAKTYGAAKLKSYGNQAKEKIGQHYAKLKDTVTSKMNQAEAKVQSTLDSV